ncbi:MAG: ECF transporter S component [Clostridiales bacterium]|nr:ECF transporter S component [Clostridiales bacterium]
MERKKLNVLVNTALLSAISVLLMLVEFPLPMFPPWLKFGFSDVPSIIGGFAFGPGGAIAINVIKNLMNIVLKGPSFGGVGELANLLMGCAVALTATMIYRKKRTVKGAAVGLAAGVLAGTVAGVIANIYMLVPAAGIGEGTLAGVMTALCSAVGITGLSPMMSYALIGVVPFNIIKMGAEAIVVLLIYRRVVPLMAGKEKEK